MLIKAWFISEIYRNSASGSTSVLSGHYSFQNSSKIQKLEMPNHNRKPEMEEIKLNNVSSAGMYHQDKVISYAVIKFKCLSKTPKELWTVELQCC